MDTEKLVTQATVSSWEAESQPDCTRKVSPWQCCAQFVPLNLSAELLGLSAVSTDVPINRNLLHILSRQSIRLLDLKTTKQSTENDLSEGKIPFITRTCCVLI